MRRVMLALLLALASAAPGLSSPASAQTPSVDARAEVAAALFAASATQAAELRNMDARLRQAHAAIEQLQARGQSARAELIAAQERYVADLAQRDRAYAREIGVFRAAVTDIAATPEGLAILAQRRPGNLRQARTLLLELIDRQNAAEQRVTQIRQAANLRTGAIIALDDRAKGEATTEEVIALFAAVTRLDAGVHSDWVVLARLFRDGKRLSDALRAAGQAVATADNEREHSTALTELGRILLDHGDAAGARRRYEEALAIAQRLADADPGSAQAQRDLSISLEDIGHLLIGQGDLTGARTRYEQSLAIARRLAERDPTNTNLQHDIATVMVGVGEVLAAQGDLAGARAYYEQSIAIMLRLSERDAANTDMQRDVLVALSGLGEAQLDHNDIVEAQRTFETTLPMARRLAAADSSSAEAQHDLAHILALMGEALARQGNLPGGMRNYQESVRIEQALVRAEPSNVAAQEGVRTGLSNINRIQRELANAGSSQQPKR